MVNLVLPQAPPDSDPEPKKLHKKRNLRQIVIYLFCLLLVALALGGLWYAQTQGYLQFLKPVSTSPNISTDSADTNPTRTAEFIYPATLEEIAAEVLFKDNGNVKWLKKDGSVSNLTTLAKGDTLSAGAPIYDSPIFVGNDSWAVRKCVLSSTAEVTCGLYRYDMDSKLLNTLAEKKTTNDTIFSPISISSSGNLVAFYLNASADDQSSSAWEIHVYDLTAKKDSLVLSAGCNQSVGGRGGGIDDSRRLIFSPNNDKLLYINTFADICSSGEEETIYVFDVKSNAKLYSSGKGKTKDFSQAAWLDNDKFYFKDFSRSKEILIYDLTKKDYSSYYSETGPWYRLISQGTVAIYAVLPESVGSSSKPVSKIIKDKKISVGSDYFLPSDFISGNHIYGELIGYCGGPCGGFFEYDSDGNAVFEVSSGKLYRVKNEQLVTGAVLAIRI